MSFLSRWAEGWVGSLERNNPEAVYASAVEAQRKAIDTNKGVLASTVVRRNKISKKLEGHENELRNVMTSLPAAVKSGDDETALVLIQRKEMLLEKIESLVAQIEQASADVETAKVAFQKSKENLVTLEKEKVSAIAELKTAQAMIHVQEVASSISDDDTARGLNSVRESILRMEAQAAEGFVDSEGRSMVGRAEAASKKANEIRARQQLEAMKAASGVAPAPADDTADDEDDEASAPKKRSL